MIIHLHWLWIPLIVSIILLLLSRIFEDPDIEVGPITFLAGCVSSIYIVIYIIAGIWWLFTHITILT